MVISALRQQQTEITVSNRFSFHHNRVHTYTPSAFQFQWLASTLPKLVLQFNETLGKKDKVYRKKLAHRAYPDLTQDLLESLEKFEAPVEFFH